MPDMKLHKILVEAVIRCVAEIFSSGRQADKTVERTLKHHPKWGARDRAFVAEYTYEFVRWWRLLQFISDTEGRTDQGALWHMFAALHVIRGNELPDWSEFRHIRPAEIIKMHEQAGQNTPVRESIPDWIYALGKQELGDAWDAELHALNKTAPLVIRVNTLKTTKADLAVILQRDGVETEKIPHAQDALKVTRRTNLFRLRAFTEGLFEVQDASSQTVAPMLEALPGMRVIDACAGAGGKTLHLAALMKNKGRIIALDTEQWKLDELMRRARRAGAGNIETRLIDSSKTIKRLAESADRLLLDVPCSGLGVLRRNPDSKWKTSMEFIEQIRKTQQDILESYTSMLKPAGRVVYATCSVLPSENEKQVSTFLSAHDQFRLIDERRISATEGYDGFYMAAMERCS